MKRSGLVVSLVALGVAGGWGDAVAASAPLTYSTWYGGALASGLQAGLQKSLNAAEQQETLQQLTWPAGQYLQQLQIRLVAGTEPRVLMTNSNRFFVPMAEQGAFAPIDEHLLAGTPIIADLLSPFRKNGRLLAVPMSVSLTGVYINLDLLREAGLDRPDWGWTWDDLLRFSQKLTKDTNGDGYPDIYGFSVANSEQQSGPFVYANGGSYMNKPLGGDQVTIDSPQTIAALDFLAALTQQYRTTFAGFGFTRWLGGTVAMAVDGSWQLGRAKQEMKSDWDFIPYPRSPATGRSASRLSIEALGLAKNAAGAQDALQLVQLGASRNAQEAFLQAGTIAIPVRRDLMDSPYFYPPEQTPHNARRFFTEALTQGYAVPETVYPDLQMRTVMEQHVQAILLGKESPKSGLEAAAQQMRGYLK